MIKIVIVKEPSLSAVILAKSIKFFTCLTLPACSCSDVYVELTKKKKQSLAITKKPCISSIFPPGLDKSFI